MVTSLAVTRTSFAPGGVHIAGAGALLLSATLPLAAFALANGLAQANGILPLYFAPSMPGWLGAALHIGSLPLLGVAHWMVGRQGVVGRSAAHWIVALIAGTIIFPFAVQALDSLMLSVLAFALLVVGLGAIVRTAAVEPRAALLMAPGLAWMGFSAFVGLSFAAGWSPPFAVTNSQGGT